jgi:hypothetical protein
MKRFMQLDRDWMIRWIIGSVSGWVIGLAIGFGVRALSAPESFYQFDQSYLGYPILGICVGLLQWRVALKGIVNGVAWTSATGLASVLIAASLIFVESQQLIPPILEYYNPGCLSASCDSFTLRETWFFGVVVLSFIGGLSVALPTGFVLVLAGYGSKIYVWVFGSFLASVLGLLAYMPISLGPGYDGTYCYLALIGPMVIAAVSAPFLDVALS